MLCLFFLVGRVMKSGKVVIVLRGRYAGRKAVVVKAYEAGSKSHKFGHALVVGIDKYPRKVTKKMSQKNVEKKSSVKPFIKLINYNHLMPTRYQVDLDLKKIKLETDGTTAEVALDEKIVSNPEKKKSAGSSIKKVLEEAYKTQNERKSSKATEGVKFLYQRLRF